MVLLLSLVTSSYVYSQMVLMSELVSSRGAWRRFPGGIEMDRQSMKKAAPHFSNISYFCVRRISPFCVSFIVHFT